MLSQEKRFTGSKGPDQRVIGEAKRVYRYRSFENSPKSGARVRETPMRTASPAPRVVYVCAALVGIRTPSVPI